MFKTTQRATQKPKGTAKKGGTCYNAPLPYVLYYLFLLGPH